MSNAASRRPAVRRGGRGGVAGLRSARAAMPAARTGREPRAERDVPARSQGHGADQSTGRATTPDRGTTSCRRASVAPDLSGGHTACRSRNVTIDGHVSIDDAQPAFGLELRHGGAAHESFWHVAGSRRERGRSPDRRRLARPARSLPRRGRARRRRSWLDASAALVQLACSRSSLDAGYPTWRIVALGGVFVVFALRRSASWHRERRTTRCRSTACSSAMNLSAQLFVVVIVGADRRRALAVRAEPVLPSIDLAPVLRPARGRRAGSRSATAC